MRPHRASGSGNRESRSYGQDIPYGELRGASVRGSAMGVGALALQSAVQVGSVAILARLLAPSDFGLVAMALTFVSLLLSVADFGLVMASTQSKRISDDQLSTLFWLNVAGGLILAMLTGGLSVLFARVYSEPRLVGVALVLSCQFIALGIGAQHEAIVRRELKYVAFYGINAGSQVVGLAAGVVGAFVGIGFWALVGQIVVAQIVRTSLLWWKTGWRPRRILMIASVRPMLQFGMKLAPASLLSALSRVVDFTIIGAAFGTHDLGLYQRGGRIVALPTNYVSKALVSTVPSSLSRLQDDDEGFSRFFINSLAIYCLATFAPIGLIAAEAPSIVSILLGSKWSQVVPLLRWLALAGLGSTIGASAAWALVPRGEVTKLLALRVARLCLVAIGVIIGLRDGPVGVAAGHAIGSCASVIVELLVVGAAGRVRVRRILAAIVGPLCAAVAAGGAVSFIHAPMSIGMFIVETIIYSITFFVVYLTIPGSRDMLKRVVLTVWPRMVGRIRHSIWSVQVYGAHA